MVLGFVSSQRSAYLVFRWKVSGTWCKPPNSPQDIFQQFESLIDKVDSEQKDFYLLGDLNCNMQDGSNHNSSTLTNILDIYMD